LTQVRRHEPRSSIILNGLDRVILATIAIGWHAFFVSCWVAKHSMVPDAFNLFIVICTLSMLSLTFVGQAVSAPKVIKTAKMP
jgi:hypothetical protein